LGEIGLKWDGIEDWPARFSQVFPGPPLPNYFFLTSPLIQQLSTAPFIKPSATPIRGKFVETFIKMSPA
jgi:hypothetical protein